MKLKISPIESEGHKIHPVVITFHFNGQNETHLKFYTFNCVCGFFFFFWDSFICPLYFNHHWYSSCSKTVAGTISWLTDLNKSVALLVSMTFMFHAKAIWSSVTWCGLIQAADSLGQWSNGVGWQPSAEDAQEGTHCRGSSPVTNANSHQR